MKQNAKRIVAILSTVFLLAALAFLFLPRHYEDIPLKDCFRFGMTPAEARSVFGAPETAEESSVSSTLSCAYHADYEGAPAEYHLRFVRVGLHYELAQVTVNCQADSDAEISRLAESMQRRLRSAYETLDGYYEETIETGFTCGIDYGAVCVSCEIQTFTSGVTAYLTRVY